MDFEPEFKYRSFVVFSCRVYDLSCYGLSGHVLADIISPRIAEKAKKPLTTKPNPIIYTQDTLGECLLYLSNIHACLKLPE